MGLKRVKVSDIKLGPIRHESLPDTMLDKIRNLYEIVGRYTCSTLEEWEVSFMRDQHPEREIGVWSRIALAWDKFHEKKVLMPEEQEKDLVFILIGISMGVDKEELCKTEFSTKAYEKALACFTNPKPDVEDGQNKAGKI